MKAEQRDEWLAKHLAICNIEPMYNQIIVKRYDPAGSIGAVIVPDVAKETPDIGRVVKLAPVVQDGLSLATTELPYLPGEKVYIKKFAGKEIQIGGDEDKEYVILAWDDVIAYVPGAQEDPYLG